MIRHAAPVRFDRIATSGRNRPLLIAVETSDGQEHEAYLKASGRPELGVEGLANEALAACLAGDLGLPVTEPFLVALDPTWIRSIPEQETRDMLQASAPIGFGSKAAGHQWKMWSPSDAVTASRSDMALQVLAFDAFIDNDDRKSANPNCLVKGDNLRIIDHELSFRLHMKLWPRPEPWKPGYLHRLVTTDGHIFGAALKGRGLDLAPIRHTWSDLPDTRLQGYASCIPAEWGEAREAVLKALQHVRTVRDRLGECLAELQRALT